MAMQAWSEVRIAFAYLPKDGTLRECDKSFTNAIEADMRNGFDVAGTPYLLPQTDREYPRICVLMVKRGTP